MKTVKKRKFADEVLDLDCEWINCDFNSSSVKKNISDSVVDPLHFDLDPYPRIHFWEKLHFDPDPRFLK